MRLRISRSKGESPQQARPQLASLMHASFKRLTLLGGKNGGIYGFCKELKKLVAKKEPTPARETKRVLMLESCRKALREQVVMLASMQVG